MASYNCPVCNKKCEDVKGCYKHKRNNSPTKKPKKVDSVQMDKDYEFYRQMWKEREHICQSCFRYLGSELRTFHIEHLLPKAAYPDFRYESKNIAIVCLDCHSRKTMGHPTEEHQKLIDKATKELLSGL